MIGRACRCANACPCHAISAARRGQRIHRMTDWRTEEDAFLLRRHDAGDTLSQLRVAVNDRFERSRSLSAVRDRLAYLGRSLRDGWFTAREVETMLGASHHSAARWHARGLLPMTRHKGGHWFRVSRADLDAFIRAQAGILIDPSRVTDPRIRALAETAARTNTRGRAS